MSHTNIRSLAKELNLSISTVSKALKDSYEISYETKERVLKAANELNYKPNAFASGLRRKKSNTIAVVIPEVADSFFSLAIKGIEEISQTKGYHVLIYLTYESWKKEQAILEDLKNGRVDGILMSVSSETSCSKHIKSVLDEDIPVILFDRIVEGMEVAKIITDDFESGYKATNHLIENGCTKIAFLSVSTLLDINNKRLAGYKKALTDKKKPVEERFIIQCGNDFKTNYEILKEAMLHSDKPDGIIGSVENLITPLYLVIKDLCILSPSEVKLISFSNLQTAEILNPTLTTITQPAFEIGKAAATILFNALEKRNYNWKKENIVIPSELCTRESSIISK
jgi:LacI family transcriptional regulator